MTDKDLKHPALDATRYWRDRKAAFMAYLDALETCMWAYDICSMRYVTVTDHANRFANPLHPAPNAQGRKAHVLPTPPKEKITCPAFIASLQHVTPR